MINSPWLSQFTRRPEVSLDSDRRCRELVNNLPQAIFSTDTRGTCVYVNSRWHELTGFSAAETVGSALADCIHPQDRARFEQYLVRVVTNGPQAQQFHCVRKNGECRSVEIHARPLGSDSMCEVIGSLSDVTQRTHDEHMLRAKHHTLESLLANLPGMVYRCRNDEHWTMEYLSEGCRQLTGYAPEGLINNRTLTYARLIHAYDRHRVWNEVPTALQSHRSYDLEYRLLTLNNEERWVWERGHGNFSISGELLNLEGYIADITKDKLAQDRLRHEQLYDPVTTLPNPALFSDRLQAAIGRSTARADRHFIVVLLQLDEYERLASSYDTSTADRIITGIARRLAELFGSSASLSRLRNDRIALLLECEQNVKAISRIIQQIQERILSPWRIDEREIYITASFGVATNSPGYTDSRQMLADADTALSRANALGGGRYEVFDLRTHAQTAAQSKLESELEQALNNGQLEVFWQPIVSLASGAMVGLEARLVWQHPRRGRLFAKHFVPNIEHTELILPLWEWMLAETSKQITAWREDELFHRMAFNIQISGSNLLDVDAILRLCNHLDLSGPHADTFALAVPEDVLNHAPGMGNDLLDSLSAKQIKLILDKFGGGLTALSTLWKMPVSMIKLDHGLTGNWDANRKIITAITALAHDLDLTVIAGCIASEPQMNAMRELGVDLLQGEQIAPPMDRVSLLAAIEDSKLDPANR